MSDSSSLVFIPDEEFVWLEAEVVHEDVETRQIEVVIIDELYKGVDRVRHLTLPIKNLDTLPLQNLKSNVEGMADMCSLNFLHEAGILHNLNR